jgi:hypothetical protein
MPILRYFVVAGLALLGCLFAADYFVPKQVAVASLASEPDDALANWRASEARKSVRARSAETNNFTQSYAMFAPSPAFGLHAHEAAALDAREVLNAPVGSEAKTETKVAAVKQDAPRKPRRQQVAATNGARSLVPPPSADSLRQDAISRDAAARAAFAQQRPMFGQPQWPQQQAQAGGFREANARAQNPFAPRMW